MSNIGGEKDEKEIICNFTFGVMALGLAGCSNPVSDSKKELEDAKKDLKKLIKNMDGLKKKL